MDLLRFITAGSVDDGKSTLIGRLLYDTKSILVDQMEAIERASKTRNQGEIDLALLTDGLRSEREQGITIDVAYKYFQTPKRKFICIDAPGHIQYTRNMVTGASNADLAIILIDARLGVSEQTRRHSLLASMLRLPHVVVAVNKMDLMDYSEEVFTQIQQTYLALAQKLHIQDLTVIPVSALKGDNIVEASEQMPWYQGPTLLQKLETVPVASNYDYEQGRFPVQYVIRPQTDALHDYRGYAGRISSGVFRKGDAVTILPSALTSTIKAIEFAEQEIEEAQAPQSVILHLADDVDVSRGDMIALSDSLPTLSQDFETLVCWMDDRKPLKVGAKYLLQHGTTRVRCSVKTIQHRIDINTYEEIEEVAQLSLNDIARIVVRTASPIPYDSYDTLRTNGAAILLDETSNVTVGACMIC